LIGIRERVSHEVFSGIHWGTNEVFSQTIAALEQARIKYAVLPGWYDIDTVDDLNLLIEELAASGDAALRRMASAIDAVLAS
jgi:glycosyltransferase A (GT-A) superfamily protein (DUF2064 family)